MSLKPSTGVLAITLLAVCVNLAMAAVLPDSSNSALQQYVVPGTATGAVILVVLLFLNQLKSIQTDRRLEREAFLNCITVHMGAHTKALDDLSSASTRVVASVERLENHCSDMFAVGERERERIDRRREVEEARDAGKVL